MYNIYIHKSIRQEQQQYRQPLNTKKCLSSILPSQEERTTDEVICYVTVSDRFLGYLLLYDFQEGEVFTYWS